MDLPPSFKDLHFGGVPYVALRALARGCTTPFAEELNQAVDTLNVNYRVQWYEALTEAETAALEAPATGKSLPTLAENLFSSVNTLKSQVCSVYAKLQVADR